MSICWVTGARGQLGKALREYVEQQNDKNYLFLTRATLDVTDNYAVEALAKKKPPSCIINLAAYTDVDGAEDNSEIAFLVNAVAVKHLAMVAENSRAVLIQVSTDYVFDGTKNAPYLETDKTNPLSVYGRSKLQGENYAQNLCSKYLVIRTSWIFSEFGKNFVTTMIDLLMKQTPVRVVNDQIGGPTSAKSLAYLLYNLANKSITDQEFDHWGIYHFCQKPFLSWFDFCLKTNEFLNKRQKKTSCPKPCTTAEFFQAAMRPRNSTLNCSKIEKLGIAAGYWQSDLERIINLRDHA